MVKISNHYEIPQLCSLRNNLTLFIVKLSQSKKMYFKSQSYKMKLRSKKTNFVVKYNEAILFAYDLNSQCNFNSLRQIYNF